jgi:hypothetical protein
MARICTVCRHAKRQEIDRQLVGGVPTLKVAGQYKLARTSVRRHQASHLVEKMVKATKSLETRDVVEPVKLVEEAELAAFLRKLSQRGHAVFGRKREHDDTVIAVTLAVWWADRMVPQMAPALAPARGAFGPLNAPCNRPAKPL